MTALWVRRDGGGLGRCLRRSCLAALMHPWPPSSQGTVCAKALRAQPGRVVHRESQAWQPAHWHSALPMGPSNPKNTPLTGPRAPAQTCSLPHGIMFKQWTCAPSTPPGLALGTLTPCEYPGSEGWQERQRGPEAGEPGLQASGSQARSRPLAPQPLPGEGLSEEGTDPTTCQLLPTAQRPQRPLPLWASVSLAVTWEPWALPCPWTTGVWECPVAWAPTCQGGPTPTLVRLHPPATLAEHLRGKDREQEAGAAAAPLFPGPGRRQGRGHSGVQEQQRGCSRRAQERASGGP